MIPRYISFKAVCFIVLMLLSVCVIAQQSVALSLEEYEKLRKISQQYEYVRDELKVKEEKFRILSDKYKVLQVQTKRLENKLFETRKDEKRIEELSERYTVAQKEIVVLEKALREVKKNTIMLEMTLNENEKINNELKKYIERSDLIKDENKKLRKEILVVKSSNDSLELEYAQYRKLYKRNEYIQKKLEKKERITYDLEKQITRLKDKNSNLAHELNFLKQKLESIKESDSQEKGNAKLDMQMINLEKTIKELRIEKENLLERIDFLEKELQLTKEEKLKAATNFEKTTELLEIEQEIKAIVSSNDLSYPNQELDLLEERLLALSKQGKQISASIIEAIHSFKMSTKLLNESLQALNLSYNPVEVTIAIEKLNLIPATQNLYLNNRKKELENLLASYCTVYQKTYSMIDATNSFTDTAYRKKTIERHLKAYKISEITYPHLDQKLKKKINNLTGNTSNPLKYIKCN